MSQTKAQLVSGTTAQDLTVDNINTTSINSGQTSGRKNLIINGAMQVAQRGTSFSSNNAAHYMLDRFRSEADNDGAFTISQSTTAPDEFSKSLKVDITSTDTSLSAAQYQQITYKVEAQDLQHLAYGTSAPKTITLSFYVRSNKTGNYNFVYEQPDNGNRLASYQYTINSANTWERKVITTTGDTSGVINDDNGVGLNLKWGLAYGSTYTSGSVTNAWAAQNNANFGAGQDVNLLDSTSNEWYITGVQLEVGSTATDFERRTFGEELALCQRYYNRYAEGADHVPICMSSAYTSSINIGIVHFPCKMRTNPTVESVNASNYYRIISNGSNFFASNVIIEDQNSTCTGVRFTGATGVSQGTASYNRLGNASAYVAFDAEL